MEKGGIRREDSSIPVPVRPVPPTEALVHGTIGTVDSSVATEDTTVSTCHTAVSDVDEAGN